MKQMFNIVMALCAASLPPQAMACEPGPPDVQAADALFVGYVTGERWPDMENEYLRGANASKVGNARGYPMLLLRIAQTESLKGHAPDVVEAISPCALPIQAGERVLVEHSKGEYRVYPSNLFGSEQAARNVLRKR
jgi:hypothetical protein